MNPTSHNAELISQLEITLVGLKKDADTPGYLIAEIEMAVEALKRQCGPAERDAVVDAAMAWYDFTIREGLNEHDYRGESKACWLACRALKNAAPQGGDSCVARAGATPADAPAVAAPSSEAGADEADDIMVQREFDGYAAVVLFNGHSAESQAKATRLVVALKAQRSATPEQGG